MNKLRRLSYFSLVLLLGLALLPPAIPAGGPARPARPDGAPMLSLAAPSAMGPEQVTPEERERLIQEALANLWRYLSDLETHRPQPLTPQAENGQIAYVGTDGHLYLMPAPGAQAQVNPDGTGQYAVVTDLTNIADPAWSSDSEWLAFVADGGGGRCLYRLQVATSTRTQVTCGFLSLYEPFWAPDGNHLAFWGQQAAGLFRAWAVPAASGAPVEMAPSFVQVLTPRWLDDDTVLISGEQPANIFKLYRVDLAQPDSPTAITPEFRCSDECTCDENDVYLGYPHLSPDSAQVSFVGGRTEGDKYSCTGYYAVYLVDPLGSATPSKITDVADTSSGVAVVDASQWAPDNQRVGLYASGSDGVMRVNVVDTLLGSLDVLHGREGGDWDGLAWAPDATQLAAGYLPGGAPEVDAVNPAGDVFTVLAQGDDPAWSTMGALIPPVPVQYPILLVHGWQGLDPEGHTCSDGVRRWPDEVPPSMNEFGNLPTWLQQVAGYENVFLANLDSDLWSTPPLAHNALADGCLKDQIEEVRSRTSSTGVIIIAHSMGGLVSRAYIESYGYQNDVRSLFTLGSPHAGVPTGVLILLAPDPLGLYCTFQPAFCEFSDLGMWFFNLTHQIRNGVGYHLVGGDSEGDPPFFWGAALTPLCGLNDHLVCVSSARYLDVNSYQTGEVHSSGKGAPHHSYFEPESGREYSESFCDVLLPRLNPGSTACSSWGEHYQPPAFFPSLPARTPLERGQIASGQVQTHTLTVDTPEASLFALSWLSGTLALTLTSPLGEIITPAYAQAHPDIVRYEATAAADMIGASAGYYFTATTPGDWTLLVGRGNAGGAPVGYNVFALMQTTLGLLPATDASWYAPGATARLTATLSGNVETAAVQAIIERPDGLLDALPLVPIGDNLYTATYVVPESPGYALFRFLAVGTATGGTPFEREAELLALIASNSARLTGIYADYPVDSDGNGFYERLAIDVGVEISQTGDYVLSGLLVGPGQVEIDQTTHYAALAAGSHTVTLLFDGNIIRDSGLDGPYTLAEVYLLDNTGALLPADSATDAWVTAPYDHQRFGRSWDVFLPLVLKE